MLRLLGRHFEGLSSRRVPVRNDALSPGDIAARLPERAPRHAREFDKILRDVEDVIFPGLTHWQHPRFMAYYPSSTSVPAILAETLIAGSGVVGLQWAASPAATELEVRVMDWLAEMIGVGGDFLHTSGRGGGIIQNTAGEAIANIMVAARVEKQRQLLFGDVPQSELTQDQREETYYADSSRLVAYMSDQSHFSGPKAVRVAGMRLRTVAARLDSADGSYGLRPDDLAAQIREDRAQGLIPCAVQLNYGTTNTSSNDEIESFGQLASEEGLWLHVDAAYAGASWILPQFRPRTAAVERVADSFNFNGSKWFLCGFDSAFLWVRERKLLQAVFAASGPYLAQRDPEAAAGVDPDAPTTQIYDTEFKDWSVPLGRRFRSLRVWTVLNYFGVEGLQAALQSTIDLADDLRGRLESESSLFDVPVTTELGLVVFSVRGGDEATRKVAEDLLGDGKGEGSFLVYPSQLQGKTIIRVALGGALTDSGDIDLFWQRLVAAAKSVQEQG